MSTCTWSRPFVCVCVCVWVCVCMHVCVRVCGCVGVCWNMVKSEFRKESMVRGRHVYTFLWSLKRPFGENVLMLKDYRNFNDSLPKCAPNWLQCIYLYTTTMTPAEEAELDHILVGANYTECNKVTEQPGPSPALIGAITTPTKDTVSTEGMAPHEGRKGEMRVRGGSC